MFYKVQAKCGHVGRNKYVLKLFYVQAESAKEAAHKIRFTLRVKHHHKDAIRYVEKIDYSEYISGILHRKKDLYFNAHNSSDQKRLNNDEIMYETFPEHKRTRNVLFKLKKRKMQERISRRMIYGELNNG